MGGGLNERAEIGESKGGFYLCVAAWVFFFLIPISEYCGFSRGAKVMEWFEVEGPTCGFIYLH